ncbi:hypothetical protein HA466_0268620 [Hirschfeldia incana]|nr:hypothetical protein HA466_0268620 [Hirschfeldia incana]
MSSSGKNDLQPVEKNSNHCPAKIDPPRPQVPLGITRKELTVVHLTAKTVAGRGLHFEQELMRSVSSMNPEFQSLFQFLNPSDSRRGFFDEVALVYTRSLPPVPLQLKSGYPSTAFVLEVFFNVVRFYLDHDEKNEQEQGEYMDFPYHLETDWSSKPIRWQHPTPSVNDLKFFAVGSLDAYRDCDWYDYAVSKGKEYNDYLLRLKTEYNRQFPAEESIPMSLGFGESALVPQDHGLSTIKDDSDHMCKSEHVGAGEALIS